MNARDIGDGYERRVVYRCARPCAYARATFANDARPGLRLRGVGAPLFSAPVFQRRRGRRRRRRARRSMVKAKLRKKAERAERASKSATTVARDAGEVAAAEDDVEDAMANLTSHHRRKVKKRAVFLESTS